MNCTREKPCVLRKMFCEWNVYRKSIVTLALSPYRQSTVLAPQPYHFRRRLVVYALTLPSLPQFLSSFVCSSVWWHWTKPGSFPLHSVYSQHPLYPPSSSFCCTIRSDRYAQPWPFLPYWNLDQTHYHRCWISELHTYTLLTDHNSP